MKEYIWDNTKGGNIPTPENVAAFMSDIEKVCLEHNLSIGHEDQHGSFIIEPLSQYNIDWLLSASLDLTQ